MSMQLNSTKKCRRLYDIRLLFIAILICNALPFFKKI